METARLSIRGMRCEGCARGVVYTLKALPGVQSVEARHDPGEAVVTYDSSRVSLDTMRQEIRELGYEVA